MVYNYDWAEYGCAAECVPSQGSYLHFCKRFAAHGSSLWSRCNFRIVQFSLKAIFPFLPVNLSSWESYHPGNGVLRIEQLLHIWWFRPDAQSGTVSYCLPAKTLCMWLLSKGTAPDSESAHSIVSNRQGFSYAQKEGVTQMASRMRLLPRSMKLEKSSRTSDLLWRMSARSSCRWLPL